jgi:hypothetical protein
MFLQEESKEPVRQFWKRGGPNPAGSGGTRRRRYWTLLQLSGAGLLLAGAATFGLVATAGATGPASGSQITTAAQPVAPFTAGLPFDSGQVIDLVIPANDIFVSTTAVHAVECAAPNGVIPTQTSACDGNTLATAFPEPDGSLDWVNDSASGNGYTVYNTPDTHIGDSASGPQCGNTTSTECILYIGDNQLDFTQPHYWSQGFFVNPDPTDSGTVNPGDGSPPAQASAPDPGLSTVVATPTTVTADGVNISTVTVTLLATGNLPVTGKTVSLASSSSTATVTGPSPATTDANGQTTFTVTDTVGEPVTLTATDTTDSVTVTQTATVNFQTPVVNSTNSTVIANPTTVTSGGMTTITVTLRDQGVTPQPIAGKTVTLHGTGSVVITPAANPNVTDASGAATFTATDPVDESVTFTATDTTDGVNLSSFASVTFGTLSVSPSASTVTASSPAPLGATGTDAVVTLRTASNTPVSGKEVTLQATSSGSSVVIGAPSPSTTDGSGQVSFKLTDTVAESVTLQAVDTTDGVTLTSEPTVVFATSSPSASQSTVTASGTTSPADGETQTLITVTVNDQFGQPLSGKTVTMAGSPSGNVQVHPIAIGGSDPGVTNASGNAQFEADDTVAEMVTFTATDTTDSIVISKTVSVTYTAGPADPTGIGTLVTVDPANPPADGVTPSKVTVTLADHFSNPVSAKTIALKGLNGSSTVTAISAVTNAQGQATFNVTDATAEVVTYQATDVTDANQVLASEGVVTFGTPPIPPASATFSSVVANPTSVPADGTDASTVSVLLYDDNGDPVPGKTVTLSADAGKSTVTATSGGTTNNSGIATFAVSDASVEAVKYTANDTSDSLKLTALAVTVNFTTASGSSGGTTTTTSGSSTTTTTSSTPTTVPPSAVTLSSTGNTGASGSSATLATTGAPTYLPWLVGIGAAFLVVGTLGRRRFSRVEHLPDGMEAPGSGA